MPIKKSSYKALRKSKIKHLKNIATKSALKTLTKDFEKLLAGKKLDEAKKELRVIVSKIGRAASKGVIKKNTASRKISRLMKKLSTLAKT